MTDVQGTSGANTYITGRFYIEWFEVGGTVSLLSDFGFNLTDGTRGTAVPTGGG